MAWKPLPAGVLTPTKLGIAHDENGNVVLKFDEVLIALPIPHAKTLLQELKPAIEAAEQALRNQQKH
jgi:predicted NAD/FAD-dependent oxidoreductase